MCPCEEPMLILDETRMIMHRNLGSCVVVVEWLLSHLRKELESGHDESCRHWHITAHSAVSISSERGARRGTNRSVPQAKPLLS